MLPSSHFYLTWYYKSIQHATGFEVLTKTTKKEDIKISKKNHVKFSL